MHHFQLYSQVLTSELVLYNSGKVDMDFTTFGISNKVDLAPGGISVQPPTVCQTKQYHKVLHDIHSFILGSHPCPGQYDTYHPFSTWCARDI